MNIYPLKNYIVTTSILEQKAFGWIRFDKHRNWISLDSKPLEFCFALTSREEAFQEWDIKFFDQYGRLADYDIEESNQPHLSGITNYPALKSEEKRFFKVTLRTKQKQQIFTCSSQHGPSRRDIFNFYPSLSYPSFIFEACQIFLPSITNKQFNNFVETGSLFGHTSLHASNWFNNVYSIEVSQELYDNLPVDWASEKGVEFIKGDTAKVLPGLCSRLNGPTVFFIDAHWSGGDKTNWQNSAFVGYPISTSHRGITEQPAPEEQKPIIDELAIIVDDFEYEALLIIDDWQLFGKKDAGFEGLDWTHITQGEIELFFDNSERTIFHRPFDGHRYVVGISSKSMK